MAQPNRRRVLAWAAAATAAAVAFAPQEAEAQTKHAGFTDDGIDRTPKTEAEVREHTRSNQSLAIHYGSDIVDEGLEDKLIGFVKGRQALGDSINAFSGGPAGRVRLYVKGGTNKKAIMPFSKVDDGSLMIAVIGILSTHFKEKREVDKVGEPKKR